MGRPARRTVRRRDGFPMSDLRPASLPKRFYKAVSLGTEANGFSVLLDGKPLRTPGRHPLVVPHERVGTAIATEWDAQTTVIDPATMPLTRLANTVVDGIVENPAPVRDELKRYAETDLLFYRADAPERLVSRQAERWDPVLRWAETQLGGLFQTATGVMHVAQPTETLAAVGSRLDREIDPFVLAGLHQMTTLTGSLILALAVRDRHLEAEEAWALAHLDEDWNIEQWGVDDEASARRGRRFSDMRAAALMGGR